ncbi:hypothetical protein [Arthrospiribacter ruber]|uniref:Lipoprotein n=1 Tax=Arthrospiribacter ruber TaxID=2487934 RepID=A0A951IYP8_9BACT|nr:hypothetical protein [Arthrospiribacter ruber]MBW3468331.1 hypothetical protein [Arthrospiribacter ruber]
MNTLKYFIIGFVLTLSTFISSCDIGPTDALQDIIQEDLGYIPVISNFTLRSPTASETSPTAGTDCTFDLRYWSEGEIDRIQFWVKVGGANPERLDDRPYEPAFSNITKTDSLLFNYTIPNGIEAGTVISMEARITNTNLPDFPVSREVNVTVR